MHDNIRATHGRRRARIALPPVVAAAICVMGALAMPHGLLAAATTESIDPQVNALPAETGTAHELHVEQVERGAERLELSARLTEDGGLIQRPIAWKLRRAGGETVFVGKLPTATIAVEPGDYVVEANYGAVHAAESVSMIEGERLRMTFILNVGGVRVLPRLSGIGLPPVRPLTTVYATSGPDEGKLITISDEPGEIMRLAAGTYRIESRFAFGNATAAANVTVKPGLLSSIEIDHHAGVAHFLHSGSDPVGWTISDTKGENLLADTDGDIVLIPGRYTAHGKSGDASPLVSFTVKAGQRIEVPAP